MSKLKVIFKTFLVFIISLIIFIISVLISFILFSKVINIIEPVLEFLYKQHICKEYEYSIICDGINLMYIFYTLLLTLIAIPFYTYKKKNITFYIFILYLGIIFGIFAYSNIITV